MTTSHLTVSVPNESMRRRLAPVDGAGFAVWDMVGTPPAGITMAVVPYMSPVSTLRAIAGTGISIVQSQSIGYDGVADVLPAGTTFCNAAGVHEASTAELAVALTLASLRGIPEFALAQAERRWAHDRFEALADKRVLVIGQGGVGRAAAMRFRPFEVELVRVASTARTDEHGAVHAVSELAALLPEVDVVLLAVPLTPATTRLVDDDFLGAMKRGSLLVNVSRGAVVDTHALVAHARDGRVRAALDVTDPEPLPADHPLWTTPGILITPHVGGDSTAMAPRVDRLIREQAARLVRGDEPLNVVLRA
ncbi:2-hydroxyacid dehydrogenase [Parafrigoribacterium mesophilum]|uniref:2-hydroxyacid dehydrogenase n=1 Tax=Parafrigoribacterium mesophilum TaxID=433646 RepID=UPI0031FBD103